MQPMPGDDSKRCMMKDFLPCRDLEPHIRLNGGAVVRGRITAL